MTRHHHHHHHERGWLERNIKLLLVGLVAVVAVGLVVAALLPRPVNATHRTIPTDITVSKAPTTPMTMADVAAKIAAPGANVVVSVLGDSTGNEPGEWVDLWAKHLAKNKTVLFNQWGEETEKYPTQPVSSGNGDGTITIWNGSKFGSQGQYARDRQAQIQPVRPDLIIYNYGHNPSTQGVLADIQALQAAAEAKYGRTIPFVVTLQNPAQGTRKATSAAAVQVLRDWTTSKGIPVVDVPAAWAKAGAPAAFLADEVHPNATGERIWTDAVIALLG